MEQYSTLEIKKEGQGRKLKQPICFNYMYHY